MSEQEDTYYIANEVRAILTGSTDNDEYDGKIAIYGPYADSDVENDLAQFTDVPLSEVTDAQIINSVKNAANLRTAAYINKDRGMVDKAKSNYDDYLTVLGLRLDKDGNKVLAQGGIIGRLKSIPTSRTKPVLVATDPRNSKMPLPTQAGIYAFDDWA